MSNNIISVTNAATELLRLYNNGEKTAYFSEKDFMENGPGRLVSLADFKFVEYFFSGKNEEGNKLDFSSFKRDKNGDVTLKHSELISIIYK